MQNLVTGSFKMIIDISGRSGGVRTVKIEGAVFNGNEDVWQISSCKIAHELNNAKHNMWDILISQEHYRCHMEHIQVVVTGDYSEDLCIW